MDTITINIQTPAGLITIESKPFRTSYTFGNSTGLRLSALLDAMPPQNEDDLITLQIRLLKLENEYLKGHLISATKETSTTDMLIELSDRGLETTMLSIPCANPNCDEVCIEALDAPLRLDELQSQAESACEFTDGFCPTCYEQDQQAEAQEQIARMQDESRDEEGER